MASKSSRGAQELFRLANPSILDDDDDDMLLLHQQQQHHHFVDEMMMMLSNCLFEGHISAADDSSTTFSLGLQGGGEALPADADHRSPKFPAQNVPLEEKIKRNNAKDTALMERKSTKRMCRRSSSDNGDQHDVDGAVEAEAPPSFVHVRAKRGQATDSHSLAERVRRERISVRMKMLQNLVPGCDKMIGKAHILDAIINYVKSLQKQVEFLSMKIASMSPMLEACGVHFDDSMDLKTAAHEQWMSGLEEETWRMGERTVKGPTATMFQATCSNNYEMMDQASPSSASASLSLLLLPSQLGPTSFSQDIGSSCVVQVSEQDKRNCQSNGALLQQ